MYRFVFVLLLVGGLSAVFTAAAQDDDEEREYVGVSECSDCHAPISRPHRDSPHRKAFFEAEDELEWIVADFSQGEETRTVEFANGSRPFVLDDIKYVMGSGRYAQAYIYESDDGSYRVLPAEWSVVAGAWHPLDLGEGDWLTNPAYDWVQSCAGCHVTGLDVEDAKWEDDGVQCEACHGPGSLHVDTVDDAPRRPGDEDLALIRATIVLSPDAQICGQCHSQGTATTAAHPFPVGYAAMGDLADYFALVAPDDPVHWWQSGHGRSNNMQYNEWLNSAHATSLESLQGVEGAADACLNCHSGDYTFNQRMIASFEEGDREGIPPDALTVASAQMGITCTSCHNPHADPTETEFFLEEDAYTLCTACHTATDVTDGVHHPVQQMFEGLPLVDGVDGTPSPHFSAEDGPRCVACHMPTINTGSTLLSSHRLSIIQPALAEDGQSDTCSQCHDGLTRADLQLLIDDTQKVVRNRLENIAADLENAEGGNLDAVQVALAFVENDGSFGVHNYGYTDTLLRFAEQELAPTPTAEPTTPPTTEPEAVAESAAVVGETVDSGVRPVTVAVVVASILILLVSAFAFFRKSGEQEA